MKVHFLSSDRRITKTYTKTRGGRIDKSPYPFCYAFTSHEDDCSTLDALYSAICAHASNGEVLLKGELSRPLVAESRAGSTDARARTHWICLDLDGVSGYDTVDDFLRDIDCDGVDYILQWSSSHGLQAGLRCHIFMLLETPHAPEFLKRWLQTLNLTTEVLNRQLRLTRTNCSLCWTLDITTCQNDKLLYIAPPDFVGMDDPTPPDQRIVLVKSTRRRLKISTKVLESTAVRALTDDRINELRTTESMPKRKTKYKMAGAVEYVTTPEHVSNYEIKVERGFVYFNLNGGDSWAYYHPEDNPKFIHNFKGEPTYLTSELLPSYWAEVVQRTRALDNGMLGTKYLAFRDFRSSNYYNGTFDPETNVLDLAMAKTEGQLKSFLQQHGQPVGDFIPDWNLVFNPHSSTVVNSERREINIYTPSTYMAATDIPKVRNVPPVCSKVMLHALGGDQACYEHFLNWFACIVQYLDRTGTAWVLQGIEGTGKGVLFHHIMAPLLGAHNTTAKRMEELESEFTGFIENKFLTAIDEIEVGSSAYHAKITAKLKNLIVEPEISIRKMYHQAYMARNYNNMLFSSNKTGSVLVSTSDRRYNVAPYQTEKLQITSEEIDSIPGELFHLCCFLRQYPANRDRARTPLNNAARETMIDIGQMAVDVVADALLKGDFAFFWDQLPSTKPDGAGSAAPNYLRYLKYRELIIKQLDPDWSGKLTRDDLFTIFDWCDGNASANPNKFASMLKHHKIYLTPIWIGRSVRGIKVDWDFSDKEWLAGLRKEVETNAV